MTNSKHIKKKTQQTKLLKLVKALTLRRKIQKTKTTESNATVGVKYKQRKVWSFSDILSLKQRTKRQNYEGTKDDSYVGPEDIQPYQVKNTKVKDTINREKMSSYVKYKSLNNP